VIKRGHFLSKEDLRAKLLAFIVYFNASPPPGVLASARPVPKTP
jgi:hypothetical protein